jgi:hypothetical protein
MLPLAASRALAKRKSKPSSSREVNKSRQHLGGQKNMLIRVFEALYAFRMRRAQAEIELHRRFTDGNASH